MTDGGPEQAEMPLDLCEALDDLAEELDGVRASDSARGREYRRGVVAFAECGNGRASFRLRPEIVGAATKTPDASVSARGPEWVSLQPRTLDTFALDRALAWFETAWRIAGEAPERRVPPN